MQAPNPFTAPAARRNPLAGLTPNKGRVAIYVPTTIHDEPAPDDVVRYQRDTVAESLSRWFGGYTELTGSGGWWSEKEGKLIRETVYVVYSVADPATIAAVLPRLVEAAQSVAVAMEQEAVTLEVNGTVYFVPGPKATPTAPTAAAAALATT